MEIWYRVCRSLHFLLRFFFNEDREDVFLPRFRLLPKLDGVGSCATAAQSHGRPGARETHTAAPFVTKASTASRWSSNEARGVGPKLDA